MNPVSENKKVYRRGLQEGQLVTYTAGHGAQEVGFVTSWNETCVFVRYWQQELARFNPTSAATAYADLTYGGSIRTTKKKERRRASTRSSRPGHGESVGNSVARNEPDPEMQEEEEAHAEEASEARWDQTQDAAQR